MRGSGWLGAERPRPAAPGASRMGMSQMQCDALVPGGWTDVATEATLPAVRRFGAWLGQTIDPAAIGAHPLQEAA